MWFQVFNSVIFQRSDTVGWMTRSVIWPCKSTTTTVTECLLLETGLTSWSKSRKMGHLNKSLSVNMCMLYH